MQHSLYRWLATPLAIAIACAAGCWLYIETAFWMGLAPGLRCLFAGQAAGTCMTSAETIRFWTWAVASGALSGMASVLLAVSAAPRYRTRVRLVATLATPVIWLWFGDWNW